MIAKGRNVNPICPGSLKHGLTSIGIAGYSIDIDFHSEFSLSP
jgi:hypothetical protein